MGSGGPSPAVVAVVPTLTVVATAYIAACVGCSGVTASGLPADFRKNYVAASPAWPLGACVELEIDGAWRRYTVQDRGPKKADHIDILVATKREAVEWGVRTIAARKCEAKQ